MCVPAPPGEARCLFRTPVLSIVYTLSEPVLFCTGYLSREFESTGRRFDPRRDVRLAGLSTGKLVSKFKREVHGSSVSVNLTLRASSD